MVGLSWRAKAGSGQWGGRDWGVWRRDGVVYGSCFLFRFLLLRFLVFTSSLLLQLFCCFVALLVLVGLCLCLCFCWCTQACNCARVAAVLRPVSHALLPPEAYYLQFVPVNSVNRFLPRPSPPYQLHPAPLASKAALPKKNAMKPSLLVSLLPAVTLAHPQQPPSAVDPSPSVPNTTPPAPLPLQRQQSELSQSQGSGAVQSQQPQLQQLRPQPTDVRSLNGSGRGTVAKSLQARSEGTLGQSPWIGMAIGLTCTAFAAVMLG